MDEATQRSLINRLLGLIANGRCEAVKDTGTVPIRSYLDPERFRREQKVLFRRFPQPMERSERLEACGDFVTHDHGETPVLMVRGDDGRVRAFLNVCRHRGTRLVNESCGRRRRFACPYHGWVYDSLGKLVKVPGEWGFSGSIPEGLAELPCEERHGFVWVVPAPGPQPAIDAWLGTLDRDFTALGLLEHMPWSPFSTTKKLNWKLVFDIFLEAYHLKVAHAKSISPIFFDNIGAFDQLGAHQRNLFPKRSIVSLASQPKETWELRKHANILYLVFPNTLILVQPDHVSVFNVYPKAIDETLITGYTLLAELPVTDEARAYWQKNIDILLGATEEDFALGESIQAGLSSGANKHLTIGRFEPAITRFHTAVEQALTGSLPHDD